MESDSSKKRSVGAKEKKTNQLTVSRTRLVIIVPRACGG